MRDWLTRNAEPLGAFGEPDKTEPSKVPEREGQLVDRVKDVGIHRALAGAG